MREIKFRVYVESILPEESGMYIPDYISYIKNGDVHDIDKCYTGEYKFKDDTCKFTLMQWTGLKDKNGVEIYEGDRVKFFFNGAIIIYTVVCGRAVYTLHSFPLGYLHDGEMAGAGVADSNGKKVKVTQLEVVGNIYDN